MIKRSVRYRISWAFFILIPIAIGLIENNVFVWVFVAFACNYLGYMEREGLKTEAASAP